jgi:hypothetical protein
MVALCCKRNADELERRLSARIANGCVANRASSGFRSLVHRPETPVNSAFENKERSFCSLQHIPPSGRFRGAFPHLSHSMTLFVSS